MNSIFVLAISITFALGSFYNLANNHYKFKTKTNTDIRGNLITKISR